MDKNLTEQKCIPCQGGIPPMTPEEISKHLSLLDEGWKVVENKKLVKTFLFDNFMQATSFINRIAEAAEEEKHHPDLNLHDYRKLTVEWWTHKIGGLHLNDFIMAAKTDRLNS